MTLATGPTEPIPLTPTRTLNISDGGALVAMPAGAAPPLGTRITIQFAVPRTTQNTYMLEGFACEGRVIRHEPILQRGCVGVAFRFVKPLKLALEV